MFGDTPFGDHPLASSLFSRYDSRVPGVASSPGLRRGGEPARGVEMVGASPAIRRLRQQAQYAAPHLGVALIEGESGSGKSLLARLLHAGSALGAMRLERRDAAAWLASGPLSPARAAFAVYLERIELLEPQHQAQLLELVREIREGDAPGLLLLSTCEPIAQCAGRSGIYAELAFHLSAVRFALPPLRARRDDIAPLAHAFLEQYAATYRKTVRGLGPGSLTRLIDYEWPGNVRELSSAIEAAVLAAETPLIRPQDIALNTAGARRSPFDNPEEARLDAVVARHVAQVLAHTRGNKQRAAALLGISRSTLYRMLAGVREPAEGAG